MPLFFLIILLFMPLADIVLALRWIFSSWAGGLYFLAAAAVGALMMKFAKIGFGAALRLLRDKEVPPAAIAGFAKIWVAGALLFFPGYLTDALAVCVLLLPVGRLQMRMRTSAPPQNDEVVSEVAAEIVDDDARRID